MKITRERLEAILREEIAAVAEGREFEFDITDTTDDRDMELTPAQARHAVELGYIDPHDPAATNASGAALYKKDLAAGKFDTDEVWGAEAKRPFGEKPEDRKPNKDPWASVHKANPFADSDAYKKELEKQRLQARDKASTRRAVPYSSSAQKLRADKPIPLEESSTIDAELKEMLSLLEGHMGQEAPPVENDQRARELLDGFKNMLKPQERAEPSACATFLRQLADMAEREGGAPDAGTMPEPVPNN